MHVLLEKPPRPVLLTMLGVGFIVMSLIWLQFIPLEEIMQEGGGYGIVDYELAFTPQKVRAIFATWDADAVAAAWQSLLIDFAFMPAYGLFFGSLVLLMARVHTGRWQTAGLALAVGSLIAAALDALENGMLIITMNADPIPTVPLLVAGSAASLKFLILLLIVLYWLVSLVWWVAKGLKR